MKTIRNITVLLCALLVLVILGACQTTPIKTTPIGQEPLRTNPVDVQSNFINQQAITPQALDIASGNLFSNGDFELGLEGWTACSAGAIKPSSDAFEGSGALEVIPNNCFYRSAEVSPGQDLVLSCYVKVTSGNAWTGMGMGFADSSWITVGEAPTTVISGSDYARYDVEFTAPTNSKYASMWLYSENAAVVDNCSLMLEAEPLPPPPPSGDNLLENGGFETLSGGNPKEWSQGCGGAASSVAGREGNGFNLKGGICVDQGLSAGDVAALSGNDYTYSCYAKNTGGYASLSIFFDHQPAFKQIPVSSDYQLVEISGTASQVNSGFVSIYSEGNLDIDDCSLVTLVNNPQPQGKYIKGRVWIDENANGIQDSSERGFENIRVAISISETNNTPAFFKSVLTDTNGNYQVNDLEDGTYSVQVDLNNNSGPEFRYSSSPQNVGNDDSKDSDFDERKFSKFYATSAEVNDISPNFQLDLGIQLNDGELDTSQTQIDAAIYSPDYRSPLFAISQNGVLVTAVNTLRQESTSAQQIGNLTISSLVNGKYIPFRKIDNLTQSPSVALTETPIRAIESIAISDDGKTIAVLNSVLQKIIILNFDGSAWREVSSINMLMRNYLVLHQEYFLMKLEVLCL